VSDVNLLLHAAFLAPPHGLDLLVPLPVPRFPESYTRHIQRKAQILAHRSRELQQRFQDQFTADAERLDTLRSGCLSNDPLAIPMLFHLPMCVIHCPNPCP
jgi:hypothetical protein